MCSPCCALCVWFLHYVAHIIGLCARSGALCARSGCALCARSVLALDVHYVLALGVHYALSLVALCARCLWLYYVIALVGRIMLSL